MNRLYQHYQQLSRTAVALFVMLLTMTAQTAWAEDFPVTANGVNWICTVIDETTNVKIEPADINAISGAVTIPGNVQNGANIYTVTEIESPAFLRIEGLTAVTIPASVTSIGDHAFMECKNLSSVTFANESVLKTIESEAFNGCERLQSITIPASVETIGSGAFNYCTGLTSVTFADGSALKSIDGEAFASTNLSSVSIPASVTSIGQSAFSSCINLATITVETGNKVYKSPEGSNAIIETTSKKLIVGCKGTTIPNDVEIIGDDAFNDCSGLQSITIPASVKTISGGAFNYCSSLTSITIPENVTSIGEYAFYKCTGLTSITLNSNPVIGSEALPDNATVTMNLTANEGATGEYWTTFYNENYSFTPDASTKVYKGAVSGSRVNLTEVADIPANKAAILKSTASPITLTLTTSPSTKIDDFYGNELKASSTDTDASSLTYAYCLSKNASNQVGFYKFSGNGVDEIIPANHAYLLISGTNGARSFYDIDYDTTAIEGAAPAMTEETGDVYDLSGRRVVGQPQKGIYVRNGQKFIVK